MMKKKNRDFEEITLLKRQMRSRIAEQETEIKSSLIELRDNLTGAVLIDKVRNNLFSGSGLAFKLGFMAVTMLRKRLQDKRTRKS